MTVVVLSLPAVALSVGVNVAGAAAAGVVTNYTGTGISNPDEITAGPDDAMWFTNEGNPSIGRITTPGVVTNYIEPTINGPFGITAGPDGALWFTNDGYPSDPNNSIGRITPSGVVTNYTDPTISQPEGITAGPDGALWFTNYGDSSIGRITPSGVVTNYTGTGISNPFGITAGPDGALWFTNYGNNSIGRITPSGVVTNYTGTGISNPFGITAGPDGALWFTNEGNNSIGRITPSGVVTNYTDPTINSPTGITAGPDDAMWFTNFGNNSIGRITTDVTVTPSSLAITTTSLPNSTVGQSYSAPLAATGGTTPYTWSITSGSLPAGLTLDPTTGVISGKTGTVGLSDFTVEVTDSTSPTPETATAPLSIATSTPSKLRIRTTSLPNGTVGQSYSATLVATGGRTPYTWSIIGSLPPGLSLISSGLYAGIITGTPTTSGTLPFVVEVTDSTSPTTETATAPLSIPVMSVYPNTFQAGYAQDIITQDVLPSDRTDITSVKATWTVPTVLPTDLQLPVAIYDALGGGNAKSSTWVGLGGDNVIQTGVEADFSLNKDVYQAWWEYRDPNAPNGGNAEQGLFDVHPGDTITASVEKISGLWSTQIYDNNDPKCPNEAYPHNGATCVKGTWTAQVLLPGFTPINNGNVDGSAEIILERTNGYGTSNPLPQTSYTNTTGTAAVTFSTAEYRTSGPTSTKSWIPISQDLPGNPVLISPGGTELTELTSDGGCSYGGGYDGGGYGAAYPTAFASPTSFSVMDNGTGPCPSFP